MNENEFQQLVWDFYADNARAHLPWRQTNDPYAIYISEIMLQQTQATRVIDKYESWLKDFPTFQAVADASTKEVLSHWQGLGYNRRALYLKETCETIADNHGGELPADEDALLSLPGIGPYTAGALQAFIFEKPVVFVETNIRTVYIHHFFADDTDISDKKIAEKVAATLPEKNIRAWYWALMDYGNYLKSEIGNLNSRAASYQKQSKFVGSNRQLRAKITRFILANEPTTLEKLEAKFNELVGKHERMKPVADNLVQLEKEGFVTRESATIKTTD